MKSKEQPLPGSTDVLTPTPLQQRLNAVLEQALEEKRIVGAVVVAARDGEIVYRSAVGDAHRETRQAMRVDNLFRLASVTKLIVSVAVLRLIEAQRLAFDDLVTHWLPDFKPLLANGIEPSITVHQLLTHTAGLSYAFLEADDGPYHQLGISDGLDDVDFDLEENLRRLAKAPLVHRPGEGWQYSLAIDVLGAVIERVTGVPLSAAVAQWVTQPLGMSDTTFHVRSPERLASAYANGDPEPFPILDGMSVPLPEGLGNAVRFAPRRALNARAYPSGGAGMVATADDIMKLLEMLHQNGGSVLSAATVEKMHTDHVGPQAQSHGPGWGFGYGGAVLSDPVLGATAQSKGTLQWGGVYGNWWFIDPVQKVSVVMLTNTAYEGMSGALTVEVRDAVYGG